MTDKNEIGAAQADADQPEVSEASRLAMADLPVLLRDAALRLNWSELMPVQTQTLPFMLAGQDVMVQSQTGSGKTGAFLLPILHRIEIGLGAPQALVLVPTRELAVQVTRDAEELGRDCGVRPVSIYGGVGYKAQIQGLEDGAQLVIGTPGRILDHLLKGNLNLDRLKVLIFDEADRMLSMGFYPDMKQLQRYLPRGLQSAMFSATYPGHVKRLAQQFLKDPIFVSLSQDQVHVSDVLHVVYKVPAMQKSRILVKIIEHENPASAIIFCNTKADVHFVSVVLRRFGYDVGEISADLTQAAREEVLEKLRLNKLKFLVATDVAARGIDIHELSHVFQYQPPQDHEAYVHRTGRTGRAGAAGVAISLVSGMEEIELEQIAKKFSIPMVERTVPADEELETLVSQRAVFLLEARLRKADNIQKERMQRFVRTVGELAANEDSRALLAMLIDEFYQGTFHAPLEQPSGRLIEPARPARSIPVESLPTQESSPEGPPAKGRAEGEKRRRKRSRKKPAGSAEVGIQDQVRTESVLNAVAESEVPAVSEPEQMASASPPEPARPERVRQEPRSARPPKTTPRVEQEAVAPKPEEPAAESVVSGDIAGDVSGEVAGEGQAPAAPKKRRRRRPRKSSGAKPESGEPMVQGEAPAPPVSPAPAPKPDRRESRPKSSEAPAPKPARARETPKSGGRKPAEAPAEPSKPRKKIFLE
jgi:ATP-dependent RNA helicase DeaD